MNKAKCDKCNKEFNINVLKERVKDDVTRTYFICPHCNTKYIAYYSNSKIEQKQIKAKKLIEKMKKYYLNTNNYNKTFKEYKDLAAEIKNNMEELRKKYD